MEKKDYNECTSCGTSLCVESPGMDNNRQVYYGDKDSTSQCVSVGYSYRKNETPVMENTHNNCSSFCTTIKDLPVSSDQICHSTLIYQSNTPEYYIKENTSFKGPKLYNSLYAGIPLHTKGDRQKMSYCCLIANRQGIVLAADSRSVRLSADKKGLAHFNDDFQKIVYLPNTKIFAVFAGRNDIDNMPICNWALNVDSENNTNTTPRELGQEVQKQLKQLHICEPVQFCFAQTTSEGPVIYCADYPNEEGKELYQNCFWQAGQYHEFDNMLFNNGELCVNISGLSLPQMIEFGKSLVEFRIALCKFRTDLLPVVGGTTQMIAVNQFGEIILRNSFDSPCG